MSSLYNIKILQKPDNQTIIVHVKVIHPDAMWIPEIPGFALMLLNDNAGNNELSKIVDLSTVMDIRWST